MRTLKIFTLLLIVSYASRVSSQTYKLDQLGSEEETLQIVNTFRSYFDLGRLELDEELSIKASKIAQRSAMEGEILYGEGEEYDSLGEAGFWSNKNYIFENKIIGQFNIFSEAFFNQVLNCDNNDEEQRLGYYQWKDENATKVGFGIAQSMEGIYVHFLFDNFWANN